jgi:RNA-directed DNA polymerase
MTRKDVDADTIASLSHALKAGAYCPDAVRRHYIPKRNGKLRPLGIPTLRDRIVQAAVAMVLEAIYEPNFRPCSHGFRPGRSTTSALRHVAYTYRSGASWIIEGDIKSCFDALPHSVILEAVRKRVRDERFIALIARFLKAGVMEEGKLRNTYSGTPQGGIVSPLLANIALHELDLWMEAEQQANLPKAKKAKWEDLRTEEHKKLSNRIKHLRFLLKQGPPFSKGRSAADIVRTLKELEAQRRKTRPSTPNRAIYYVRYADDFLVILCAASKDEAHTLKEAMATWLQEKLGLMLSEEKTLITHVSEKVRFLGYEVQGVRNENGTRWARLTIPVDAQRAVVERLKQATRYTPAPELDVFTNVNAIARGWANYYRHANHATDKLERLTGIVFWVTMGYLTLKHDKSTRKMMKLRYGRDPRTGRSALFANHPNGSKVFLWNKPPKQTSILAAGGGADDRQPPITTSWAGGNSIEKKAQTIAQAGGVCEGCGRTDEELIAHHPKRLRNASSREGSAARSGYEQRAKALCRDCHKKHHHGSTSRK